MANTRPRVMEQALAWCDAELSCQVFRRALVDHIRRYRLDMERAAFVVATLGERMPAEPSPVVAAREARAYIGHRESWDNHPDKLAHAIREHADWLAREATA